MNSNYDIWNVMYTYFDSAGNIVIVENKVGGTTGDIRTTLIENKWTMAVPQQQYTA